MVIKTLSEMVLRNPPWNLKNVNGRKEVVGHPTTTTTTITITTTTTTTTTSNNDTNHNRHRLVTQFW